MFKKIKKVIALMLMAALLMAVAGCSNNVSGGSGQNGGNAPESTQTSGQTKETETEPEEETETSGGSGGETAPGTEAGSETVQGADSNILVAYFSLAGEQYGVGTIDKGNTEIIAEMIAEQTGGELFQIEPVEAYPQTYDELLEVAQQENRDDARPEIVSEVTGMEDYNVVFIGYPNWYGDMPKIVRHFLESYDFSGKTVVPFCTHGGSGLSGTERTIADITGAEMSEGFAIAGSTAQNDQDTARSEVSEWLKEGGFTE